MDEATIQNLIEKYELAGSYFHYYAVCETKLWYYHYRLLDNSENEYVQLGSQIDIQSYKREEEVSVGTSRVDFLQEKVEDGQVVLEINEVKKSSKMEEANELQLLHYLFLLSDDTIKISGKLRFPEERKTKSIEWTDKTKEKYSTAVKDIVEIITAECPPPQKKKYCNKCSMNEFCFSSGDDNER